jgi:hypothetical protein
LRMAALLTLIVRCANSHLVLGLKGCPGIWAWDFSYPWKKLSMLDVFVYYQIRVYYRWRKR